MIKEQEQPITPAVIAMRQKKGLAVATGNPLDKIELNPKEVEKNRVQSEETLISIIQFINQHFQHSLNLEI